MAARRVEVIVTGKVQTVGFRDRVQEVALRHGVAGEIRNLPDRSVKVVAEAEPETLERFLEEIREPTGFIRVEEVRRTREGAAKGLRPPFKIKRGPLGDELGERLDQGVLYLQAIHKDIVKEVRDVGKAVGDAGAEVRSMHTDMNSDFHHLDEKYDVMSQLAREMAAELREMKEENARMRADFLVALDRHAAHHNEAMRELRDAIRERRV